MENVYFNPAMDPVGNRGTCRCPKCGKAADVDISSILASYPPKYNYTCPHCGHSGYIFCSELGNDKDVITPIHTDPHQDTPRIYQVEPGFTKEDLDKVDKEKVLEALSQYLHTCATYNRGTIIYLDANRPNEISSIDPGYKIILDWLEETKKK